MGLLDNVQFFGAVDRVGKDPKGKIASEYPAFYFPQHLREKEEETARLKRELANNIIPASEVPYARADLKKNEEMIATIKASVPKLNGKEKDELGRLYEDMQQKISDSMYSRTDMKKGLVDVHEEARRMSEPIIPVDVKHRKFMVNHGIIPKKGKITRNEASRAYKMSGRVLDANTNTEALRRDYKTGVTKFEKTLRELLQEDM